MTVILKENCSHTPQADQRQVKHSRQSRSNKTSLHHQLSLPGNGTLLVIFYLFFDWHDWLLCPSVCLFQFLLPHWVIISLTLWILCITYLMWHWVFWALLCAAQCRLLQLWPIHTLCLNTLGSAFRSRAYFMIWKAPPFLYIQYISLSVSNKKVVWGPFLS